MYINDYSEELDKISIEILKLNNIEIINNQFLEIEEATLFSLLGQKISNWKINSSEKSIKIPVKNIETGVYIVKLKTTDNLYFSQKIIVK